MREFIVLVKFLYFFLSNWVNFIASWWAFLFLNKTFIKLQTFIPVLVWPLSLKNLLSSFIALYLMLNKREGRFKSIFKVPLYKTAISFGDCVHVYSKYIKVVYIQYMYTYDSFWYMTSEICLIVCIMFLLALAIGLIL